MVVGPFCEDAFPPVEMVTSSISKAVFVSSSGNPFKAALVEILNELRNVLNIVAPGVDIPIVSKCKIPALPFDVNEDASSVSFLTPWVRGGKGPPSEWDRGGVRACNFIPLRPCKGCSI